MKEKVDFKLNQISHIGEGDQVNILLNGKIENIRV